MFLTKKNKRFGWRKKVKVESGLLEREINKSKGARKTAKKTSSQRINHTTFRSLLLLRWENGQRFHYLWPSGSFQCLEAVSSFASKDEPRIGSLISPSSQHTGLDCLAFTRLVFTLHRSSIFVFFHKKFDIEKNIPKREKLFLPKVKWIVSK